MNVQEILQKISLFLSLPAHMYKFLGGTRVSSVHVLQSYYLGFSWLIPWNVLSWAEVKFLEMSSMKVYTKIILWFSSLGEVLALVSILHPMFLCLNYDLLVGICLDDEHN